MNQKLKTNIKSLKLEHSNFYCEKCKDYRLFKIILIHSDFFVVQCSKCKWRWWLKMRKHFKTKKQ